MAQASNPKGGEPRAGHGRRLLAIYLNDHLAGAVAGSELAKRCSANNRSTSFAADMEALATEIREDLESLERIISELGIQTTAWKRRLAWTAERFARLKLNGQLRGYSLLSRIEEIEGMCIGVEGKRSLWRTLQRLSEFDARLSPDHLARLEARASSQRERLERCQLAAVQIAFAESRPRADRPPTLEEFRAQVEVILPPRAAELRGRFLDAFVDTEDPLFEDHMGPAPHTDGHYYKGFLWDFVRDPRIVSEEEAWAACEGKDVVHVMWDIHTTEYMPYYYKFPVDAVLRGSGVAIRSGEFWLPDDLYLFDDTFQWTVVLTSDLAADDKSRLCFVATRTEPRPRAPM